MMLIATPETMWSTPKITVAIACSSPPMRAEQHRAEDAGPRAVVVAEVAGTQVPRIIMPSRPMLTTPARSDHRPPSPASRIGHGRDERGPQACRSESMSSAPVIDPDDERARAAISTEAIHAAHEPAARRASAAAVAPASVDGDAHAVTSSARRLSARAARRPRRCSSRDPVAADDLVGDDHGEHDDALGDQDDVGEMSACDLSRLDCSLRKAKSRRRRRCRSGCCGRAAPPRCR